MVQRQGPASAHLGPVRTCVGCRAKTLATGLLRTVAVAGSVVPDPGRRLPGRGAWLHPHPDCLRAAQRRRAFPRALRTEGQLEVAAVQAYLDRLAPEPGSAEGVAARCEDRRGNHPRPQDEGSRSTRHESAVKLKP